jgi:hypothetical protein
MQRWLRTTERAGSASTLPVQGASVGALAVWNGELVAGGQFVFPTTAGPFAANIACWDGSTWRALGTGVNGMVRAFTLHAGQLVACGQFTLAGGSAASGIAPSLVGAQVRHQVASLQVGTGGVLTGIASSNALTLTVGVF